MKAKKYYLVEDNKIVTIDGGGVNFDTYKKEITINQVRKILCDNQMVEKKEFKDWFLFSSPDLEINVVVRQEDDYYDLEKRTATIEEFVTFVDIISFSFKSKPTNRSVKIINALVNKFGLSIYDVELDKHYTGSSSLSYSYE